MLSCGGEVNMPAEKHSGPAMRATPAASRMAPDQRAGTASTDASTVALRAVTGEVTVIVVSFVSFGGRRRSATPELSRRGASSRLRRDAPTCLPRTAEPRLPTFPLVADHDGVRRPLLF